MRPRLAELGAVALGSTPDEMRDRIEREIKRWTRELELRNVERQYESNRETMWPISRISENI